MKTVMKSVTKGNWIVNIQSKERGYFENSITETSGELIFENNTLVEYDGVYELPKKVVEALKELGFSFGENILPDNKQDKIKVKYPNITVNLSDSDGNAFALLGAIKSALKKNDVPKDQIDEFFKEATAGDYNHLLQVCLKWVDVI